VATGTGRINLEVVSRNVRKDFEALRDDMWRTLFGKCHNLAEYIVDMEYSSDVNPEKKEFLINSFRDLFLDMILSSWNADWFYHSRKWDGEIAKIIQTGAFFYGKEKE